MTLGECSRCGECCKWLILGLEKDLIPDRRKYLTYRGMVIRQGFVMVSHPCKALQYFWRDHPSWVCINPTQELIDSHKIFATCLVQDGKPDVCRLYHGKRRGSGGRRFYIPDCCTMKDVR